MLDVYIETKERNFKKILAGRKGKPFAALHLVAEAKTMKKTEARQSTSHMKQP